MKKILVAFDGLNYSPSLSEYAIEISRGSNSLVVGVFLYDLRYTNLIYTYAYEIPATLAYSVEKIEKDDEVKITDHIRSFAAACEKAGVNHKVHLDRGVPLMELLKESAFADLILVDAKTSFFDFGEESPSAFLKDLLAESKCPVMIVPGKSEEIKNVVISYDGSESSIYAMKMFSYLFPEWNAKNTTIVSVNKSTTNHVPEGRNVKDLADRHFKNLKYEILNGNVADELPKFLKRNKNNSMVVMGSYGRTALSRMFHSSISNKVIKDLKMPVFI
ncbi:MAG: universal stress protein, partial [Chitinophagales bacterium]